MGNPYDSVTVSNYNSNPPADDGSQVASNRVSWATQKTKLADPLKTAIEAINTATNAAFGKSVGSAGIVSTAVDYQVLAADQGKLIKITGSSSRTITTPDATVVGAPFAFAVVNLATLDAVIDGSGSQTVDGAATITVPAEGGVMLETDGSNWFTYGKANRTQIFPQGRLTPSSGAPVTSADSTSATAIYYTEHVGNLVPVSDGTKFTVRTFSELTLTLVSNHTANTAYDVFLFNDSGTLRIGTGPAWNNSTAGASSRGTGAGTTELTRLSGLYVNNVSITARNGSSTYSVAAKAGLYLGSIIMDGTNGQISCHRSYGQNRKFGIWNKYNQVPIILKAGDATGSWGVSTTLSARASNGNGGNATVIFMGLSENQVEVTFSQNVSWTCSSTSGATAYVGVGLNTTSSLTVKGDISLSTGASSLNITLNPVARYISTGFTGLNVFYALEQVVSGSGTFTITWNGGEDDMLLTAEYLG